jgi:3-(3-hydroxy-phenyl)propionate hydroxylase
VPIFGVRGLNSGFEDAANLAWKLAAVVKGEAAQTLLASYSDERVDSARRTIGEAAKSTWFMTPPSDGYRIVRDAVLELAVDHDFVRGLINPRQAAPSDYRASSLTVGGDAAGEPDFGAPGTLFPDAPIELVRDGRRTPGFLADALGDDFTVVAFLPEPDAGPEDALIEQCAALPVAFAFVSTAPLEHVSRAAVCAIQTQQALRDYAGGDACLYVVRPDGYVCARLRRPAYDTVATIVRAAGALNEPAPAAR